MTNITQKSALNRFKPTAYQQKGLVLIVTMLALIIMMLASVALIRSTDANLQIAGNMAFKRDLVNQAERAIPDIQKLFKSGALKDASARYVTDTANHYYATQQASNDSGIPNVLMAVTTSDTMNIVPTDGSGITIRYVIDRMCLAVGPPSTQACSMAGNDSTSGCDTPCQQLPTYYPVYRMTLRVTGPRNTEAYLQTTYTD